MSPWMAVLAGYLLGSVDFAVVVARSKGVDIHAVGSGNPGTSNVLRTLGRGPAAMVLVGDMLKGVIASAIGWLAGGGGDPVLSSVAYAAVFAAVAGHAYPVFHRFRGGKGVATAGGGFLFIIPLVTLGLALVWGAMVKLTKVASISSSRWLRLPYPRRSCQEPGDGLFCGSPPRSF